MNRVTFNYACVYVFTCESQHSSVAEREGRGVIEGWGAGGGGGGGSVNLVTFNYTCV